MTLPFGISGIFARKLAVLLLAGAVLPLGAWGPFGAKKIPEDVSAGMVPHKAVYDIKLVSRHSGSPILNITGKMYFSWKQGCEAWTTDHRFKLRYEYANNPPMLIESDFSTYEPFSGETFDFISRRSRNGEIYEELRGHADPQRAVYITPDGLAFDLPQGAYFPMSHTVALARAMKTEKVFFTAPLFDGSDTEGPVTVNTFIGPAARAPESLTAVAVPGLDAGLITGPARKVRFAFFPMAHTEPESDYEMDAVIHENGVISTMRVDYDEFSVSQTLAAVEPVPVESCDSRAAAPGKPLKK